MAVITVFTAPLKRFRISQISSPQSATRHNAINVRTDPVSSERASSSSPLHRVNVLPDYSNVNGPCLSQAFLPLVWLDSNLASRTPTFGVTHINHIILNSHNLRPYSPRLGRKLQYLPPTSLLPSPVVSASASCMPHSVAPDYVCGKEQHEKSFPFW